MWLEEHSWETYHKYFAWSGLPSFITKKNGWVVLIQTLEQGVPGMNSVPQPCFFFQVFWVWLVQKAGYLVSVVWGPKTSNLNTLQEFLSIFRQLKLKAGKRPSEMITGFFVSRTRNQNWFPLWFLRTGSGWGSHLAWIMESWPQVLRPAHVSGWGVSGILWYKSQKILITLQKIQGILSHPGLRALRVTCFLTQVKQLYVYGIRKAYFWISKQRRTQV